jgi:CRISPR system Cascade subunit CasD
MANTLFVRLEGPLQAWGERSRWTVRETAHEPTKSGVVGVLACALGIRGDSALRELSSSVRVAVRCDRPGTLIVDYHTVVGGVLSADGKVKRNQKTKEPETVVSERHYLSDASFLAVVQADDEVINRVGNSLTEPVWPVYLGRKSCVPSVPLFEGTEDHAGMEEALSARPARTRGQAGSSVRLRAVVECAPGEGVLRRDELLSASARVFGPRHVRETVVTVPVAPDPMADEPDPRR